MCEPDDMDEIFERMTRDLDLNPEAISATTTASLSDIELVENFNRVKRELYARGELLNPTTDTGKDLGAEYHGLLLEMKKRGLQ